MLILFCSDIQTHLIILKSLGYFCSVEEKKLPYKVIGGKPTIVEYSADDIFAKIKQEEIKFIDLQFTSLPGRFHHTTISSATFTRDQIATMMPKPISMDSGSGMHTNVSLWKSVVHLFTRKCGG